MLCKTNAGLKVSYAAITVGQGKPPNYFTYLPLQLWEAALSIFRSNFLVKDIFLPKQLKKTKETAINTDS
jgi:hypothetical protein